MDSQVASQILLKMYKKFAELPLGGKKVPTPYRRNEFGKFQKLGPEFQGKSSPEALVETTKRLAKKQNFDLEEATAEEIREFMRKNKLGIDCSGFAYRMLNFLVESLGLGNLENAAGMEHVGRTNVAKLTSSQFTKPVRDFKQTRAGDLIKLNSGQDLSHCLLILSNESSIIVYSHSSSETKPDGVHTGKIVNGKFPKELNVFSYDPKRGDGVRRLKLFA